MLFKTTKSSSYSLYYYRLLPPAPWSSRSPSPWPWARRPRTRGSCRPAPILVDLVRSIRSGRSCSAAAPESGVVEQALAPRTSRQCMMMHRREHGAPLTLWSPIREWREVWREFRRKHVRNGRFAESSRHTDNEEDGIKLDARFEIVLSYVNWTGPHNRRCCIGRAT